MFSVINQFLFIFSLVFPPAAAALLIIKKQRKLSLWLLSFLLSSVACFFLYTAFIYLINQQLERKLAEYDLNGDGIFSGTEITPAMQKAMRDVTSDTGRSMGRAAAVFTCPIYSAFWHLALGIPYMAYIHIKRIR